MTFIIGYTDAFESFEYGLSEAKDSGHLIAIFRVGLWVRVEEGCAL
jgi:hypothetical protein